MLHSAASRRWRGDLVAKIPRSRRWRITQLGQYRPERRHPTARGGLSYRLPQDGGVTRKRSPYTAENLDRKPLSPTHTHPLCLPNG